MISKIKVDFLKIIQNWEMGYIASMVNKVKENRQQIN